ncbi:MAG: pilus assembly protein PilM [Planctomycetota bacterium]
MPSSNSCWGLDIGAGEIKAIKLERVDDDAVALEEFAVIPHKRVLSTPGIDQSQVLKLSLGTLMNEFGDDIRRSQVAVSIAGHQGFARFAKLPPEDRKNVGNLIKYEAVQQIPFPIEQVEWDHQVFADDDSPDLELGIFAATRSRIGELLTSLGESGIDPTHLNLSPVSAFNAISYDLSFTEETEGTVILDVGTHATDLIVAEGGRLWIRTFPLGGHRLTEALAEAFRLEYVKAEKLKRTAETSKYKKHAFQALQPVLSDLIQDVQRSLGYYQDSHPDAKLTRLIGLGSTFKVLGMRKLLEQQLKIRVHRLEGFRRLSVEGPRGADFEAASLNLATAYGLALQGLGMVPIRVNLMPIDVLRDRTWKRKTPFFVGTAAMLLVAGGLSFYRGFVAQQAYRPLNEYSQINSAVSRAKELQREWEQQAGENQPEFVIANANLLLGRKALYGLLLEDIGQMNAFASAELSPAMRDAGPVLAFDVASFETEYLAPGTSLADTGGDRERDRRGGGPSAGEFGAVRVRIALDTPHAFDPPFIERTVLTWLRTNLDRRDRPYVILEDSGTHPDGNGDLVFERVRQTVVRSAQAEGEPTARRGREGRGGGAGGESELDRLAPLPAPTPKFGPDRTVRRWEVTWVVQLRESAPASIGRTAHRLGGEASQGGQG